MQHRGRDVVDDAIIDDLSCPQTCRHPPVDVLRRWTVLGGGDEVLRVLEGLGEHSRADVLPLGVFLGDGVLVVDNWSWMLLSKHRHVLWPVLHPHGVIGLTIALSFDSR